MNALPAKTAAKAAAQTTPREDISCYHCGDDVPDSRRIELADEKQFCCEGCRAAHEIISGAGYDNYYRFRTGYSPRPNEKEEAADVLAAHEKNLQVDAENRKQGVFLLEGLHCASCVWLNEKILRSVPGMVEAEVHLGTGRAYLTWDTTRITLSEIGATLRRTGYRLVPFNDSGEKKTRSASRDLLRRMVTAGFFAGNSMLISVSLYAGYLGEMERHTRNYLHLAGFLLAVPVFFYSANVFFRNAWAALRNRTLTMDLLTSLGITLAFTYSTYVALTESGEVYFDSICFIVFFVLLGRWLEQNLRLKSMEYVENLRQSAPRFARVRDADGEIRTMAAAELEPGMVIQLDPDERAPVDGVLLNAKVNLDESALTGEFRPVPRNRGEIIAAGTRVLDAPVEIRAVSTAEDGALGRIEKLASAGLRSVPRDVMAKASRRFIAFVLMASVGVFFFWLDAGLSKAVLNTISLLIVACPCALSLAVPSAYIIALQHAFRRGCLVRNGEMLRSLAKVRHLALDKTGTLTRGKPRLIHTRAFQGSEDEALDLARRMQLRAGIRHPLARAFLEARNLEAGNDEGKELELTMRTRYAPGRGILVRWNSAVWILGSGAWMRELGLENPDDDGDLIRVHLARKQGRVIERIALFELDDAVRPDTAEALNELRGFARPFLLTGDARPPAMRLAKSQGLEEVMAEKSPEEKADIVAEKSRDGGVCMVGDGINDGIALSRADCGISFAHGADTALGSADILLLGEDLRDVPFLFRLARATRAAIRRNLTFAFVYNLTLIPLAFAGLLSPLAGALFMSASSLTVTAASLWIRRVR